MKITPNLLHHIYDHVALTETSKENMVASIYASYHVDASDATLRRIYYDGPPYLLVKSYADLGIPRCLDTLTKDIHKWLETRLDSRMLLGLKALLHDDMWQMSSEDYPKVVRFADDADGIESEFVSMLMARVLWYSMYCDCAQAALDSVV